MKWLVALCLLPVLLTADFEETDDGLCVLKSFHLGGDYGVPEEDCDLYSGEKLGAPTGWSWERPCGCDRDWHCDLYDGRDIQAGEYDTSDDWPGKMSDSWMPELEFQY
jgi:hypothetical protein